MAQNCRSLHEHKLTRKPCNDTALSTRRPVLGGETKEVEVKVGVGAGRELGVERPRGAYYREGKRVAEALAQGKAAGSRFTRVTL